MAALLILREHIGLSVADMQVGSTMGGCVLPHRSQRQPARASTVEETWLLCDQPSWCVFVVTHSLLTASPIAVHTWPSWSASMQ